VSSEGVVAGAAGGGGDSGGVGHVVDARKQRSTAAKDALKCPFGLAERADGMSLSDKKLCE
jgi:hypothetical protein